MMGEGGGCGLWQMITRVIYHPVFSMDRQMITKWLS